MILWSISQELILMNTWFMAFQVLVEVLHAF